MYSTLYFDLTSTPVLHIPKNNFPEIKIAVII